MQIYYMGRNLIVKLKLFRSRANIKVQNVFEVNVEIQSIS